MNKKALIIVSLIFFIIASILVSNAANWSSNQSGKYSEITYNDYAKIINSEELNIIFVGSVNCGYCQMITPILKQIGEDLNVKINHLELTNLSQQEYELFINSNDYLVNENWGTPLLLFFENGKLVDQFVGYGEYEVIKEFINNYL
ncbi:MAG: thioredoxin family protein [Bacilli bacterium]|jgi:predicted bacteriocin transport accessory protein|nr:thioredoxin family protein [Bacilli bacterium]